jgi:3-phenylpropionate/trans-cinnamate dioxygenase ferredoxin reductase subunit
MRELGYIGRRHLGTGMEVKSMVIIGAGHAGAQVAASLREEGFTGALTLLSDEAEPPYQRPPLSKAFLKGEIDLSGLPLRAESFFRQHEIDLRLGAKALGIDRSEKRVNLASGESLPYHRLILATGARARELKVPGADYENVLALRTIRDAQSIRSSLGPDKNVVVVGAGFIGLEIAATALKLRGKATVIEIADRPMGRAVSPTMSAFFLEAHQAFGASFRLATGVAAILGEKGRANTVELSTGERLAADVVIVGIGILAEDALAGAAGLKCENGIVVDAVMTTSDPDIFAIGDCSQFPSVMLGAALRLESVQNATDQAKTAAKAILGKGAPYDALPWFWSDQGDLKLQIAGLCHGVAQWVTRGDPKSRAFAVFGFKDGELRVVETVNRAAEHMAARRLIPAKTPITPNEAADLAFDLRKLALAAKPKPW